MNCPKRTAHNVISLLILTCFLLLVPALTLAQDLYLYLDSSLEMMPDEPNDELYSPGTVEQRALWRDAVINLLAGDPISAAEAAEPIHYTVAALIDSGRAYWLLEGAMGEEYPHWGVLVIAVNPELPHLMIQAPHSHYDFRSGQQAIRVFRRSGAVALYLNGTHRCSSTAASPCDGTTTVCGDTSAPFRESDQAHAVNGPLQTITEEFLAFDNDMVFLQLHGFVRQEGDPHIILSNGTSFMPVGIDWVVRLRHHLALEMDTLTFKIAHINTDWDRFTGTTNTQGRLVNGSTDPCDQNPSFATGRFVHMEQSYDGLRDNEESWLRVADAVAATFAETSVGEGRGLQLPESPLLIASSPNPFNTSTRITLTVRRLGPLQVTVFDVLGRRVATLYDGAVHPGLMNLIWQPTSVASGRYTVRAVQNGNMVLHSLLYLK